MFDASNYVLGPYLYCCWSLVLFWELFVAMSGFWMAVSSRRHRLQYIIIVWSFLRLLKLRKLSVFKLDLSRGCLTWCHGVLDHGLNLHRNIPLRNNCKHFILVTELRSVVYKPATCVKGLIKLLPLKENRFGITHNVVDPPNECARLQLRQGVWWETVNENITLIVYNRTPLVTLLGVTSKSV